MLRRTRATNFFDEDTAFFLAHSQKASSSDCSRIIRCFFLSSGVKDDSSPSIEKILFNLMIASVYLSLGLPPMCSPPRMSPRTSERLIRPVSIILLTVTSLLLLQYSLLKLLSSIGYVICTLHHQTVLQNQLLDDIYPESLLSFV